MKFLTYLNCILPILLVLLIRAPSHFVAAQSLVDGPPVTKNVLSIVFNPIIGKAVAFSKWISGHYLLCWLTMFYIVLFSPQKGMLTSLRSTTMVTQRLSSTSSSAPSRKQVEATYNIAFTTEFGQMRFLERLVWLRFPLYVFFIDCEDVHRCTFYARDLLLLLDGFVYTPEKYMACKQNTAVCHDPDAVDYVAILNTYGVCQLLNSGTIQELWIWGADRFG